MTADTLGWPPPEDLIVRLSASDVETDPEPPATPPRSGSWRVQLAVALLVLLTVLAAILWFLT